MSSKKWFLDYKKRELAEAEKSRWFSKNSKVYHVCPKCTEGNNIEPENRRWGDPGNRKLCDRCRARLDNGTCH